MNFPTRLSYLHTESTHTGTGMLLVGSSTLHKRTTAVNGSVVILKRRYTSIRVISYKIVELIFECICRDVHFILAIFIIYFY